MGIFSQKVTAPQTFDSRTSERQQVDQFLANFVSTYGKQYQPGKPYGDDLTAGLGSFERQGLDQYLAKYLNQPVVTPNLRASQDYYGKVLAGGFDPGTSEYYRALREEAGLNQKNAIRDLNAELGGRGKYFSSEAVKKTGDITQATDIALNKLLAELGLTERGYQDRAATAAPQLEEYLSGIPLARAKAATTVGAIPRMLEQQDLESLYQDFLRRQGELGGTIGAGSGVTSNLDIIPGSRQKSTFESFIMPMLLAGISAGAGSFLGGGGASAAAGGGGAGGGTVSGAMGNPGGFWANTGY